MFGIVISSVVNLYFTFSNPVRLLGGLPMILGQNGPGGSAGFLMFLPAFFLGFTNKKIDKLFIFFYVLILSILLLLSYSKLGMIMGVFGMSSFMIIQFRSAKPSIRIKRISYFSILVITIFVLVFTTNAGKSFSDGVSVFIEHKIGDDGAGAFDSGDEERLNYYFAVGEVFLSNPVFGVGYNGFFEAIIKTNTHASGLMSEEESSVNSNPHNAFLYYISANGFIGWIIVCFLFFTFLNIFYIFFKPYGLSGILVFLSLSAASLIHTNTLISFFNTTIMYLPAGIALAANYNSKNLASLLV
jgi:O-antigen ligase